MMSSDDRRKTHRRKADQDRTDRLTKLMQAGRALAGVESVEELLPTLLLMAQEVTSSTASSILLYDAAADELEFKLALNEDREGIQTVLKQDIRLGMGEGIAGWVAEKREPLVVDDAANDPRFFSKADEKTGFVTRCLLCAPIMEGDRLLGVVQVLNAKNRNCFDSEDLDLLRSFADMASVALVRSELLESKIKEQRLSAQLDAAAQIQNQLLPANPPVWSVEARDGTAAHWGVWGDSYPAVFVGGDLYDFIRLDDGSTIVCIADVSGKGLPAALVMVALWSKLRSAVGSLSEPGKLLSCLSAELYNMMSGQMFATALMARLLPEKGVVEYAAAGHPPPLLVDDGSCVFLEQAKGMPLGIDVQASYAGVRVELKKGQSLIAYTDGVIEAKNKSGDFFEMDNLKSASICRQMPRSQAVLDAVKAWRGEMPANDDTTLVEIWRA